MLLKTAADSIDFGIKSLTEKLIAYHGNNSYEHTDHDILGHALPFFLMYQTINYIHHRCLPHTKDILL